VPITFYYPVYLALNSAEDFAVYFRQWRGPFTAPTCCFMQGIWNSATGCRTTPWTV